MIIRSPKRNQLTFFLAVASLASPGLHAANYTLSVVAKSGDNVGGVILNQLSNPVFNDIGTVTYAATFNGNNGGGIFTQTGLQLQAGQSIGGQPISAIQIPLGGINIQNIFTFAAYTNQGFTNTAIMTQSGVVAKTGDTISGKQLNALGALSINDNGTVAFIGSFGISGAGVFTQNGLVVQAGDTIAGQVLAALTPLTGIDNGGKITFGGPLQGGGQGLFQLPGGKVAKTGDVIGGLSINTIGNFSASRGGKLAFQAFYNGGSGIFSPTGVLAKTGDAVGGQTLGTTLSDPAINDSGAFAFISTLGGSNYGVFAQGMLLAKTGDVIGGKVVSTFGAQNSSAPVSINAGGVVTFLVNYTDNTQAVVEAVPYQIPAHVPFGSVDTPQNGISGVTGAIGVTGWALSSPAITKVALWRERVPSEGSGPLIYISDTAQVPGARPDVASAFPGYPNNNYGWGAQILTNQLPNTSGSGVGNGTYNIHVLATNAVGQVTDIGTKTMTVDNAHAVLPFGTLDTPGIGAVASGTAFVNFGWALTPNPANVIPKDGSTIVVFIDNQPKGHPVYNQFRPDIATLFPGLQNSNGAVGAFIFDTTQYSNGLHNIAWSVTDNAGNLQGLGSRNFLIQN